MALGDDISLSILSMPRPVLILACPGGGSRSTAGQIGRAGLGTHHRDDADRLAAVDVEVAFANELRPGAISRYKTVLTVIRNPLHVVFSIAGLLSSDARDVKPYALACRAVPRLYAISAARSIEVFRVEDMDMTGVTPEERNSHALEPASWATLAEKPDITPDMIERLRDSCRSWGYNDK